MQNAENPVKIEFDAIYLAGKAPRMYPRMRIEADKWTLLAMAVYSVGMLSVTESMRSAVKREAYLRRYTSQPH